MSLFEEVFTRPATYSASVKCPSVKEVDMSPDNMKLCRKHLDKTIERVSPTLVFVCGNLAMKMLIKKSGITSKRGRAYEYEAENGHVCTVVPIFHPYSVIKEPRHRVLFDTDIRNAYDKYVLGKTNTSNFKYEVLTEIDDVVVLSESLRDSDETLALDIETTGLNFLTDIIQTIAISSKEHNWVIPVDHKDSPFKQGEAYNKVMLESVKRILENPRNKKVFHNAKFDLKFLMSYGIHTKNVWDTKIMHHFLDEFEPLFWRGGMGVLLAQGLVPVSSSDGLVWLDLDFAYILPLYLHTVLRYHLHHLFLLSASSPSPPREAYLLWS